MANKKIAQLTNQTALADTDILLVETATSTNKITVANLREQIKIVESGSNANGKWVKYSDGTMVCRGHFEVTLSGTSSRANTIVSLPLEFATTDVGLSLNAYGLNGDQASLELDSINCNGRMVSTQTFQAYVRYLIGTVTYGVNISYIAIGRWK